MLTKFEAKDKKKQEEGKLVKSRNEPCCIVQVRCDGLCALLCCGSRCPGAAVHTQRMLIPPPLFSLLSILLLLHKCQRWWRGNKRCKMLSDIPYHSLPLLFAPVGFGGGRRAARHPGPAAAGGAGVQQHVAPLLPC